MTFDPDRLHLERLRLTTSRAVTRSMGALIYGWAETGRAFLSFAAPDSARFDHAYLEATAAMIDSGPAAFLRPLAAAGLDDTLGDAPALIAAPIAAASPRTGHAFETVLRFPRTVRAHEALGGVLAGLGNPARAALELRIAVSLDPAAHEDRYRLASVLWEVGASDAAIAELTRLIGDPAASAAAEEARSALDRIRGSEATSR